MRHEVSIVFRPVPRSFIGCLLGYFSVRFKTGRKGRGRSVGKIQPQNAVSYMEHQAILGTPGSENTETSELVDHRGSVSSATESEAKRISKSLQIADLEFLVTWADLIV